MTQRVTCYDKDAEALDLLTASLKDKVRDFAFRFAEKFEHDIFEFMKERRITAVYSVTHDAMQLNEDRIYRMYYDFFSESEKGEAEEKTNRLMSTMRFHDFKVLADMPEDEFERFAFVNYRSDNIDIVREWRNAVRG